MKQYIIQIALISILVSACIESNISYSNNEVFQTQSALPADMPLPAKTQMTILTHFPTLELVVTPQPTPSPINYATHPGDRTHPLLLELSNKYSIDYSPGYPTCIPFGGAEISPDGKWAILESGKEGVEDFKFNVVNTFKKIQWKTPYYSEIYSWDGHRAFGSMKVEHWSKDGNFFYFSACPFADGDGIYDEVFPGRFVYTLNLNTGEIINTDIEVGATFSPSDQFVIYRKNNQIGIYNFSNQIERIVELPSIDYDVYGRFVWSPDEKKVAFTMGKFDKSYDYRGKYSVFLIDLDDLSIHNIIENNKYFTYSWTEPNLITLVFFNGNLMIPKVVYDISKDQLFTLYPITATP